MAYSPQPPPSTDDTQVLISYLTEELNAIKLELERLQREKRNKPNV